MATITIPKAGKPLGYQQLTVADTAVALTVPLNAEMCIMVSQDATVRFRDDGTDPTSTVGVPLYQNQSMQINGADALAATKFIRTGSTSAKLNILYYRYA